jgi:hypothetical protein
MLSMMLGTVVLAITYGAFWHNQPARRQNDQRGDDDFRLGRPVNHSLELKRKGRVFPTGKRVKPRQTKFFRPVLRALRGWNPWHQILVDHAGMRPSIPAYLFKPKENTNELAAEKTT